MKTKEKTGMDAVAQIVFRHSVERPGYCLCHYGHLTSEGTFAEASGQSFSEFLVDLGIPGDLISAFVGSLGDSELEVFGFGYLQQKRFDVFVRCFLSFCGSVMLYPGMLVLTFDKKDEDEG